MWLTDPCRYDRWTRPIPPDGNSKTGAPTRVSARVYVYFLGSVEAQQLVSTINKSFKVHHNSRMNVVIIILTKLKFFSLGVDDKFRRYNYIMNFIIHGLCIDYL